MYKISPVVAILPPPSRLRYSVASFQSVKANTWLRIFLDLAVIFTYLELKFSGNGNVIVKPLLR